MSSSAALASPANVDPWVPAARSAIADLAANALGCTCECSAAEDGEDLPGDLAGALVPLVSSDLPPLYIGLFSTDEGCTDIARALLGFGPSDALSRPDVVDAINEVTNMLSGSVKAHVPAYSRLASLGLPSFVHGPVEHSRGQVVVAVPARLGTIQAFVLIVRSA